MIVIVLESVPRGLRGELSLWLTEPHVNVFTGNVSAAVRDRLWDKITKHKRTGNALLIHSSNNEQGYTMQTSGPTKRSIKNYEGIELPIIPKKPKS